MVKIRRKIFFFHTLLLGLVILLSSPLFNWRSTGILHEFLEYASKKVEKELAKEESYSYSFRLLDPINGVEKSFFREKGLKEAFFSDLPSVPENRCEIIEENGKRIAVFTRAILQTQKPYFLQIIYPLEEVNFWAKQFKLGFFYLGVTLFVLYALFTSWLLWRLSRPLRKILQGIQPYREGKSEFLSHILLPDSEEKDFETLAETLNSLSGKIQTQIQALLVQHKENESILESLMEGVIALSSEGTITYINRMACQMLQNTKENFFQKELALHSDGVLEKECEEIRFFCEKERTLCSKLVTLSTITRKYINIIAIPRKGKNGVILVLQDKTADFRVLQMGKDFIANASHELKTPLTVIRGFAETLFEHPDLSLRVRKEITEKIVRMCERLNSVLKSLLTLNDVENFTFDKFSSCDVRVILENCRHLLNTLHEKAQLHIDLPKHLTIWGNQELIELALMNLLENGIKYSEKNISLEVRGQKEKDHILITITDRGIGIPQEDIEHIFERFYTVDKARSRKLGGVGLGLSIVKNIIEKHGGKITVVSKEKKGTTFSLAFPSYSPIVR